MSGTTARSQAHKQNHRNREKHEIDFIVENDGGVLLGIESKAGSAVSRDALKHLTWFRENIAKGREFIGILLYTGENVLSYGRDMYAVPVAALWE
jgi:predicted AAA+ superfamily ATPase